MNRNAEWYAFIREIKERLPLRAEYAARNAVARAKRNKRNRLLIQIPAAGVCASALVFAALAIRRYRPGYVK